MQENQLPKLVDHVSARGCVIEIGPYLALAATFEPTTGCEHIRLGDRITSLLDLKFSLIGHRLYAITLDMCESICAWPSLKVVNIIEGIPIIESDTEWPRVLDLELPFSVSIRDEDILIFWGQLENCTVYRAGTADILVNVDQLVGVWFKGIEAPLIDVFKEELGFS